MKNLFKTLSLIGLSLSLGMNAQTGSNKAKSQTGLQPVPQNEAKSAYVSSQEYLSPSSTTGFYNYYGDSLGGFDEAKIKKDILAKGLPGWEGQIYLRTLKREYINTKYGIGPKLDYVIDARSQNPGNHNNQNAGHRTIGNGGNTVNLYPCVNEDFESSTAGAYTTSNGISGWTITSRTNDSNCYPTNWTAGSNEFSIVATPILSWGSVGSTMGVIPNSPLGGTYVAQLNDQVNNQHVTRIAQQFPVTTANTLFQIAYAGYWQDGGSGHSCCPISNDQPGLSVKMYDCNNAPLSCSALSLSPGSGCQSSGVTYTTTSSASWCLWQVKYIDLTPYVGSCVTIEIITQDCAFGGHWGSTLFDARCGGQLIGIGLGGTGGSIGGPVSYCAGSNQAVIQAPYGYSTYQWYAPGTGSIAAPQGTMSSLTVTNPIPGSVYTVQLVAPSGCVFTSTNAIAFSTITIAGVGTTTTCAGGASGSATVAGNGSGTGYNYTWINTATSATVGTTAIVGSLGPGTYSVILTAFGAAGCGSAVTTVTVAAGPPGIIPSLKPYCGTQAFLAPGIGGSNYQWYNGSSAIAAPAGTAPGYTVNSPTNGSIYWLSYMSSQGCRDSLQFTLVASAPGVMAVTNISKICTGGSNGTATISLSPAAGSPPNLNSYVVTSTGTTPAYSASLFPTGLTTYTFGGLQAGTYSANVFDGSCLYATTFSLAPFVFSSGISSSATLCPGTNTNIAVTFAIPPSLGQYTYSWSPGTFLINTNSQNEIVMPNTTPGTSMTINYSVVITPTIVNCPVTQVVPITFVNPPTPTLIPVANMCNTLAAVQITAMPGGGVFTSGITGTNNPLSSTGLISPTLAANGLNTYTYTLTQYTCTSQSTGTYQVSKFWTSALTSSVPPLCITSPQFNLMNIVQNSGGNWSGGPPVSANHFNPASLPTNTYLITYSVPSTPNPTVCPSYTSITVAVTHTSTPLITPVAEFCTNALPINMTVSPTGGSWLPNTNNAISPQGVINPTLVPVPGMVGTYTVADGPCVNSNSIALSVSRYYSAGFTGPLNPICASSTLNLMSYVQSTVNGSWPSSINGQTANPGVSANVLYPSGLATGIYTLTYHTNSAPNPTLCSDTRTITISVLNPINPTITPISTLCNNALPQQLIVSPANSGHWTASPYLSSSGVFTPSLSAVGSNAVQYVVGTNTCNVQQTINISIEAFVPATIVSAIPNLCNTSPVVNLTPFTESGQGTWSGPGITGTSFNPGTTGSGHFVLMHNTSSSPSGLCPDQATVSVNVFSLAAPAITQVGPFCNNSLPVQLQVSPVGGLFGGANVGAVSLSGQFNPAAALEGNNIINYSITSGPCVAYAQTIIKVEKMISADFSGYLGPFCKTDQPVNLNSYVQNAGGTWYTYQNTPGVVGNMFDPSQANVGNTNVIIHQTESQTKNLCTDTAAIRITVREAPVVTAVTSTAAGCVPVEVVFHTPSTNSGNGVWTINDGSAPVTGLQMSHIFTTPGTYEVQFNYTDDVGCKSLPVKTNPVIAYDVPKADFDFPDEIYINEPQIQLTNQTTVLSNNTYQWQIAGAINVPTDVNPTITFPKTGKYQITLIATSVYGCTDEVTKTLEVKNVFNVFIPNSFTPNFDGLNDYFMPVFTKEGLDTKSFEMEIFDRWGHSLYYTKDATSKGWDGSLQNKGEPLKEEVYVYRIKYKDTDGNAYSKMGHVSLVK